MLKQLAASKSPSTTALPFRAMALAFSAASVCCLVLIGSSQRAQGAGDLWMRDDSSDVGDEPNVLSTLFYVSDDIWVRRLPDPNYDPHPFSLSSPTWSPLPHEGPCYRDPKSS